MANRENTIWVDYGIKPTQKDYLTLLVQNEDNKQIEKWGCQKRSPFEWMTYLTEEVGELAEAISENIYRDGEAEEIRKEAIHVATLALKIANMCK